MKMITDENDNPLPRWTQKHNLATRQQVFDSRLGFNKPGGRRLEFITKDRARLLKGLKGSKSLGVNVWKRLLIV